LVNINSNLCHKKNITNVKKHIPYVEKKQHKFRDKVS